ncbi:hypothetical protein DSO57_1038457 [Entomophthora muscae]|uniref:Uncharacterized protein n=1 Tax=Entomophthora muscae TaxID=34485 RepID=A0ACC2T9F1_9FUNG|nr:hypothetical protein DSO57_1038457 [Entomophthora muscae]
MDAAVLQEETSAMAAKAAKTGRDHVELGQLGAWQAQHIMLMAGVLGDLAAGDLAWADLGTRRWAMGFLQAMDLTFAKTKHEKKISTVYNKLCKFTEAFLGKGFTLLFTWGSSSTLGWTRL